jgi:hypothetical protein
MLNGQGRSLKMIRETLIASVLAVAVAAPAHAQKRYEVSGFGGATFGGGLSGDPVTTPAGTFTGIGVKSGLSLGASFAVVMENGGEIGVQWGHQFSKLTATGRPTVDIGNMAIDHYHAYVAYNGTFNKTIKPYISVGFGATDYGTVAYTAAGQSGEIPGPLRFSFTVGAGFKYWADENTAVRVGLQWMPTYLGSNGDGWWCGAFWGCYARTNATFSNQLELSGGVVYRFGGKQ